MLRFSIIFLFMLSSCFLLAQEGWETRPDLPEDFPKVEETEKLLFYIQRNRNKNTIVYDLNFKSDGTLNTRNPIEVYWRKFQNHNGLKDDLSWLELKFAYGYRSRKKDDSYTIKLKAYNERYIQLTYKDGKWIPLITLNGTTCILKNLYIFADESRFWPSVKYADIYGENIVTKELVKERIYNK